ALLGSLAALVVSILRGALIGASTERLHRDVWQRVVGAIRQMPLADLRARPESRDGVLQLVNGARDAATHEAVLLPQLIGKTLALLTLLVVAAVVLGPI